MDDSSDQQNRKQRSRKQLATDVDLLKNWETDEHEEVVKYSVVLRARRRGRWHAVRLWDNAHGVNEMHRYTRKGGKQRGEVVHHGSFGEGMHAAVAHAEESYPSIVQSWNR